MSFEATLKIEDKSFKVINFNYYTHRDHDKFGRPTSELYGIKLELTIEHSPDCVLLHDWAYKNHEVKSGKITFMKRDNFQKQTEVKFSDGYIVNIGTSFVNSGEQPMVERVVICAGKYEYESEGKQTMYEANWAEAV